MRVLGVVQGHEGVQGRVQEGLPHVQHRVGHAIVVVSAKKDAREGNAEGRTVDRTAVVHERKYLVRVVLEVLAHDPDDGSRYVLVLQSHVVPHQLHHSRVHLRHNEA